MASSDLSVLMDMGFDKERSELAVKKTGGLQGALQWLEDNQDKSIEDIRSAEAPKNDDDDPSIEAAPLAPGEVAKSMVCNDCGKKFRSMMQVQAHAERTEHENFSESAEEIAPLTEAEKKEKLEELRQRAAERKAKQSLVDKEEQKKNEKIRQKSTREIQDAKEELQKKERLKEAVAKRQEKLDDIAAKKRIQDKIAADKEERRLRAEKAKAEREGRVVSPAVAAPALAAPARTADHAEARLRLQTAQGNVIKTYPADTTLFEVAQALQDEQGGQVESFTMNFPRKVFQGDLDFGKTLKEANMVPSAALIVK